MPGRAAHVLGVFTCALLVTGCGGEVEQATPSADVHEEQANFEPSSHPDPTIANARDGLAIEIDRLALEFGGTLGIAVIDIERDWSTGFEADALMPQQSVSKLWVALTALDMADRGHLSLDETVRLTRDDLAVFHQPIRARILREGAVTTDIGDLIERALIESDNTANDAVLNAIGGPDAVRATLVAKGLSTIRFGPGERMMQSAIAGMEWRQRYAFTRLGFFDARDLVPDERREIAFNAYQANPVDGASAQAIAEALASLARGELLSRARTDWLMSVLRQTKSGPNRLKAGVPEGWRLAHKTGTGQFWDGRQSGYNDVGLLYAPGGDTYAVAVMIGETRRETPERMEMMQAVVRAIAAYHDSLSTSR